MSLVFGLALSAHAQTQPGELVDSWLSAIELPWSQPQKPHPSVAHSSFPSETASPSAPVRLSTSTTNTVWSSPIGTSSRERRARLPLYFLMVFAPRLRCSNLIAIGTWRRLRILKPRAAPVPLAPQAPRPGEMLTIAGYGSGSYRAATGRCTQYVGPGPNFPFEMVELSATARQGDRGGPIFNSQGQLAGVLFGEGQGRTSGSYCGRVHLFLTSISKSQQMPPATIAAAPPIPTTPRQAAPPAHDPLPPLSPAATSTAAIDLTNLPPRRTVAFTGDRVPQPPASTPAPESPVANRFWPEETPTVPHPVASDWQRYIGQTALEQLKSVLATVGAMALLLQGFRWIRSGG